ncbi:MAG: autotransporter outer membrane beta-barrel domain-containing protein [Cyanobacteria bacterium MAG IRC3_bin_20]|nr:autotransporter outer membrane beta-barrel domain-containing protein [Cyanobacteria bacterium MAG IRC3_bin_20]
MDYYRFGDAADNFSIDGRNWTFTVGVDGNMKPDLLAGVALSRSSVRSDYDYFGSAMGSDYDVDLIVVSPYLNWSASDSSLGLWASVGYGKGNSQFTLNTIGDLELASLDDVDQDATRQERDSDFFSFAGGLRWDGLRSDHIQLALKLAGSTTSFLERESQQGRLATEVAREFPFPNGVLSSSLDLAVLLDRDNPSATSMAEGLDWAADNDQFTASTVARTLLFSGDRYQWGLGAALNHQAGVRPGEGLSLSLTPSFGVTDSHLTELDILSTPEDADLAFHPWQPSARLNARLDYGIPTGNALLTPYTQFNMAHNSTVYGAGLRYQLDDSLEMDLSASHRSRSSSNNDNRILLQLRTGLRNGGRR